MQRALRYTNRLFALLVAGGVAIATLPAAVAQTEVGVNSVVKNTVSQRAAGTDVDLPAVVGDDVRLQDLIKSGLDSALQMLLLDETVFTIGANAELVIDEFVYDPNQGSGEMAASVARGAFRFMSGRTAKEPDAVSIDTPVASMGVRGTIVEGAVGRESVLAIRGMESIVGGAGELGNNATLLVLRGPSEDSASLNRDGRVTIATPDGEVTLTKSNTAVLIPDNGGPIYGPFPLPQPAVEDFGMLVGTIPTGEPFATLPTVRRPRTWEINDGIVPPLVDPEDEIVIDRPITECGIFDGIGATDGGLVLGGSTGTTIDDFGSIECSAL